MLKLPVICCVLVVHYWWLQWWAELKLHACMSVLQFFYAMASSKSSNIIVLCLAQIMASISVHSLHSVSFVICSLHFSMLEIHYHLFIISSKWTKWMAEIICSFDVCLSVCLSVCLCVCSRRSIRHNGTFVHLSTCLKWELNVNSSKTAKATDFIFDRHVPRDSPDMTT